MCVKWAWACLLWSDLVQRSKKILFHFEVFHDSLHHEISVLNYRRSVTGCGDVVYHFLNERFPILKIWFTVTFPHFNQQTKCQYLCLKIAVNMCQMHLKVAEKTNRWFLRKLLFRHSLQAGLDALDRLLQDVFRHVHQDHRMPRGCSNLKYFSIILYYNKVLQQTTCSNLKQRTHERRVTSCARWRHHTHTQTDWRVDIQ